MASQSQYYMWLQLWLHSGFAVCDFVPMSAHKTNLSDILGHGHLKIWPQIKIDKPTNDFLIFKNTKE